MSGSCYLQNLRQAKVVLYEHDDSLKAVAQGLSHEAQYVVAEIAEIATGPASGSDNRRLP